jgi:hypothetical protein
MNLLRNRGNILLGLVLLAGCSKSDDTDATGADSASESAASSDGTMATDGTTTDGTTTDETTTDGTTTDGDVCEDLDQTDGDFGPSVTVLIHNTRPDPIYIRTYPYDGEPPFALSNEAGSLLWAPSYSCNIVTCAQMMAGTCEEACPGCVCGEAIGIASGATYEQTWQGSLYQQTILPEECNEAGCSPASCVRPYQAPAGIYTVSSVAFTVVACDDPPCECSAGDDTCTIETTNPDAFQGEELQAEAELSYPDDAMVEITFE